MNGLKGKFLNKYFNPETIPFALVLLLAKFSPSSWKASAPQEGSLHFPHNQYSKEGAAEDSRGPRVFLCG